MKYLHLDVLSAIQRPGFIELVVVPSNGPRVNGRAPASRHPTRLPQFNHHSPSNAQRFATSTAHIAQQGSTRRVIGRGFHSVRGSAGSSHASPPRDGLKTS